MPWVLMGAVATPRRHVVSDLDNYSPVTLFQKTAHNILAFYESYCPLWKIPFSPFRSPANLRTQRAYTYTLALPSTA